MQPKNSDSQYQSASAATSKCGDPNVGLQIPQSPSFSINIFYQTRLAKRRCQTNCRSIVIPLLLPNSASVTASNDFPSHQPGSLQGVASRRVVDNHQSRDTQKMEQSFPFLSLPIEIRLKIYSHVLPSRTHTIVTQYPHNGYYYTSSSLIRHTTQTLYPAQPSSSSSTSSPSPIPNLKPKLTTYKLLTTNFHPNLLAPSICTEILRICKQIHDEAEPILYGSETIFDFGVYLDAVVPFLADRSTMARGSVRCVRVAREIPRFVTEANEVGIVDPLWSKTCAFLKDECTGLRTVDLTIWAERGDQTGLPLPSEFSMPLAAYNLAVHSTDDDGGEQSAEVGKSREVFGDRRLWQEWEWTRRLLMVETLRYIKVTWWAFVVKGGDENRFDNWLGRRMVTDSLVRNRMVHEGRVVEGVVVVPGEWRALG